LCNAASAFNTRSSAELIGLPSGAGTFPLAPR
jgi:hypothetical protein